MGIAGVTLRALREQPFNRVQGYVEGQERSLGDILDEIAGLQNPTSNHTVP